VACFGMLVAEDTCLEKENWMTRAMFLATAALLAMLILAPMAMGQGTTVLGGGTTFFSGGGGGGGPPASGSAPSSVQSGGGGGLQTPATGGSAILLPAAVLLLGSGILTYAFLRRR
jgi:hypothetical protein